jgi:extradiol dioxygenase family protein
MRDAQNVFHLAIPCRDLDETHRFYIEGLGCRQGRRYEDRLTIDFFGDQLVCHLAPHEIDTEPRMYPRHFGVTFRSRGDLEAVLDRARRAGLPFFREPFVRFDGRRERHVTFFLCDPSNNLIEFKHYDDPEMAY